MQRPRIYQLLPRLFGNSNETRRPNGLLAENGVGKFADINDAALKSLRDELHITHLWLTGIHAQATATDYSAIGKPADYPAILKGLAGSPYAIKDYGDVCPDYALEPGQRMQEFKKLLAQVHAHGLRVIIDFVANHVARSHRSAVVNLGATDDRTQFFSPMNHFFWLQPDSPGGGPPLRLPGGGGGSFPPEKEHGRVSGNNACTWSPSRDDWYETAKLNYGYDFTTGRREYPHGEHRDLPIPDTWVKMDAVLAHWQTLGVDGFRCDMAHMVPPEFWDWAVPRAKKRQAHVYFLAEAYDNDPMKVDAGTPTGANVMLNLLQAGFDAVYDDPAYKTLKRIYDGPAWANDLDDTVASQDPRIFQGSLRYAENHDEVRLASRGNWGGIGMGVGRAVSGVLFGISRGPVLIYSGQEVGEPADGAEGFSGDNGRTTIFDYWSMPEFAKWVNGHRYDGGRLSPEQKSLRSFYGRLLRLAGEPAFREGEFFPLNPTNIHNPNYGRIPDEPASGHWLYSYARADKLSSRPFLVVVNLHPAKTFENVRIDFSPPVAEIFGSAHAAGPPERPLHFADHLSGLVPIPFSSSGEGPTCINIPKIPPLTPCYFSVERQSANTTTPNRSCV